MSVVRSPVSSVVSSPVRSVLGGASSGGGGGAPDIAYQYSFDNPNPGWAGNSGDDFTWQSDGSGRARFYAGDRSGDSGAEWTTLDVEPSVDYTFKAIKQSNGGGGDFHIRTSDGAALLASINASAGTDSTSFTAPANGQIRLQANANWDFYMYIDEIAVFKSSATAPF